MANAQEKISDTTAVRKVRATDITENTVCMELFFGMVGTKRKVSSEKVETDADKSMVHVGKDIIDSPELKAIKSADVKLANKIRRMAVQTSILRGGLFLVPLDLIEEIDAIVERYQRERAALIDAFVDRYPDLVMEAQQRLGSLFDARDYASAADVRATFRLEKSYITFQVPNALQGISTQLFERERRKAEARWTMAAEDIRVALRESFAGMVRHMVDRLSVSEDGKKTTFKNTLVRNMEEFLDLFDKRNITSDEELSAVVKKARKVLRGIDAETLRTDDETRIAVRSDMERINSTLSRMVVKAQRRISFSDD
jgi:hypothetical protein